MWCIGKAELAFLVLLAFASCGPQSEEVERAASASSSSTLASSPNSDDLRIRVIEAATGLPTAEIPVRVEWVESTESKSSTSLLLHEKPTGAVPELLVPRSEIESRAVRAKSRGRIDLSLAGLFDPAISSTVALQPWPSQAVELIAPRFGFLHFQLRDAAANRIDASGRVRIRLLPLSALSRAHDLDFLIEHGELGTLPCGLGVELSVSGELDDGRKLEERRIKGPKIPGETSSILLLPISTQTTLIVGLLDPERRPVARMPIEVSAYQPDSWSANRETRVYETDSAGRVRVPIDDSRGGPATRRSITFGLVAPNNVRWAAWIDISQRELLGGETVLDDVVLKPEALVASGRVMDQAGEPIAGATVMAELLEPSGDPAWPRWQKVTTDKGGGFEFRSPYPLTSVRLQASADSFLNARSVEHAPATSGIVMRLVRGASATGSVVLPSGMDPRSLSIHVRPSRDDNDLMERAASAEVSADGTFALDGLWPGPKSFLFYYESKGQVGEVRDVELEGGQECRDPRLRDVGLCTGWRRLSLRIVDKRGVPLSRVYLILEAERTRSRRSLSTDNAGRVECWMQPEEVAWTLRTEEYRPVHIAWTSEEQEVRMEDGLRISVPIEVALVPPLNGLSVIVNRIQGSSSSGWGEREVVDGVAELVVPEPGHYSLTIFGVIRQGRGTTSMSLDLDPPYEFDVRADGPTRLPPCRIPESVVRAAAGRH